MASYRQDWVLSRFSIATLLRTLDQHEAALQSANEARDAISRLTAADPENQEWRGWRTRIETTFPLSSKED